MSVGEVAKPGAASLAEVPFETLISEILSRLGEAYLGAKKVEEAEAISKRLSRLVRAPDMSATASLLYCSKARGSES